jgi:hypothetical protein
MTTKPAAAAETNPALRCAESAPFVEAAFTEDDIAWAERCKDWLAESHKAGRRRALRERPKQPLILCGHGVSLRIEGGALTIPCRKRRSMNTRGSHA